ncbi:MAPEG family protein [Lysobacter capsici]|uniref:MAPEG family protein n=1 Tax=Lysobacter capsici TaxID=435897 RepID=UPI001C0063FF|nr:MAPEG family protein [Lysobacter capsici]MBW8808723.1 MAPEG family protein [Lysobacter sp.]QWF17597.1 MAPEG family protein [Lysobacter capsici]
MSMSIAYWCVLIAALLPYLWVAVAKASGKRYDNRDPRGWQTRQDNPRSHAAYAAHLNAFEAFAPFAAGVIGAQMTGVATDWIVILSIVFIVFRVLHGVFYVLRQPRLRSLAWVVGFGCVLALLVLAALAASEDASAQVVLRLLDGSTQAGLPS